MYLLRPSVVGPDNSYSFQQNSDCANRTSVYHLEEVYSPKVEKMLFCVYSTLKIELLWCVHDCRLSNLL